MKRQKTPATPFATRLSGSAKETALRLTNIFRWEKRRPPVLFLILALMLALGCGGLVACESASDGPIPETLPEETPSLLVTADTPVERLVNALLVRESPMDDTINDALCTITAAEGRREDVFSREAETIFSFDSMPGYRLVQDFDWRKSTQEELRLAEDSPVTIRLERDALAAQVYSAQPILALEEQNTIQYFYAVPKESWSGSPYDRFLGFAQKGYYDRTLDTFCSVDDKETDDNTIALELARQYAQCILNSPSWFNHSAEDSRVVSAEVFDAYYGEDAPNFCFGLGLELKLTDEQTAYWEAGSGLDEPVDGWYSWGREAQAVKTGHTWHLAALNTGGSSVDLPANAYASTEELDADALAACHASTKGFSHDWLIPYALLDGCSLDTIRAALASLDEPAREELLDAMEAVVRKHPGMMIPAQGWTLEDLR